MTSPQSATAISAGEALPAALFHRFKERFGVEILDAIGSTEVLHMFIANRPGAVRPGSSGQIIPGYEAKIVDENDEPAKPGDIGNLLIHSDSTCSHYWNQHEKSKSTIEGHWIRTGDKYYQDADGYFWYAGRSDDMLKCSGVWVSPIEIEAVLIEHPAVQEAAVIGREDDDRTAEAGGLRAFEKWHGRHGRPRPRTAGIRSQPPARVQAPALGGIRGRAA